MMPSAKPLSVWRRRLRSTVKAEIVTLSCSLKTLSWVASVPISPPAISSARTEKSPPAIATATSCIWRMGFVICLAKK